MSDKGHIPVEAIVDASMDLCRLILAQPQPSNLRTVAADLKYLKELAARILAMRDGAKPQD